LLTDRVIVVYSLKCKNNKNELAYYIFSYKFAEKRTIPSEDTLDEVSVIKFERNFTN